MTRPLLAGPLQEFCATVVRPRAEELDRSATFFPDILRDAAALGLQSLLCDASGTLDLSNMPLVHETTEHLAAESCAVALAVSVARLHTYVLARYACDELKDRWIAPTLTADVYGSFAITEPHAGTDVRALTTVARRDGDRFLLSGEKCWIGLAPVASYAIVLAKVDSAERTAPTVAVVVDLSSPGVVAAPGPELAGFRGMPNGTLRFTDVVVPVQDALRVNGFAGMMDGLNMARIEAASYACGLMRAALQLTSAWAGERQAFGRPIGDLQAIQTKIGRMATDYRAARELTLRAAESFAEGDGGDPAVVSMAKMFASDAARQHTDAALQIFAGIGMSRYHPAQRMDRDAKIIQIFDGTSEIHETMLGRRAVRESAADGLSEAFLPRPGGAL